MVEVQAIRSVKSMDRLRSSRETASSAARAEMARRSGDFGTAINIANRSLRVDPNHLGLLETLAAAYWQSGQYGEVLACVRRLVILNPYEPGYHALGGAALQCLGLYGEAARSLARAKEMPQAAQSLADLENWQARLIADMLRDDPVFRAHYAQNAAEACSQRGFAFLSGQTTQDAWASHELDPLETYSRPS